VWDEYEKLLVFTVANDIEALQSDVITYFLEKMPFGKKTKSFKEIALELRDAIAHDKKEMRRKERTEIKRELKELYGLTSIKDYLALPREKKTLDTARKEDLNTKIEAFVSLKTYMKAPARERIASKSNLFPVVNIYGDKAMLSEHV